MQFLRLAAVSYVLATTDGMCVHYFEDYDNTTHEIHVYF